MKKKCLVCTKNRGKRVCKINENELICSRCCAETRGDQCEGCSHYQTAQQYLAEKIQNSQLTKEDFITKVLPEIDERTDHALGLIEKGSLSSGEEIINELLQEYPEYHSVTYAKGVVYITKGEWDKAIEFFDKAIKSFPIFVEAHFNKGAAYQEKMDIKNMIKAYKKVVDYGNPKDSPVQHANGILRDAEREISKNYGVDFDRYFQAQELFASGHDLMVKGDFEKAMVSFDASLKIINNVPQAHGNLGICYARLGRKHDALAALDRALEIDPCYQPAIVNKARIEGLEDGEKLEDGVLKSIDYHKDYKMEKRPHVKGGLQKLFH